MRAARRRAIACCGVGLIALAVPGSGRAGINSCAELCGTASPCTVSSAVPVNAGATLDCSDRSVSIQGTSGRLYVENGSFTLKAVDLTVNQDRSIEVGCNAGARPGMAIVLSGDLSLSGFLQADCDHGGGSVTVQAEGDITIHDTGGAHDNRGIWANGTAVNASGGDIVLVSATGNVTVNDPLQADAKSTGTATGGRVELRADAGDVTIGADVIATGRQDQGGSIEIEAKGDAIIGGKLEAGGRLGEGHGGTVAVTAGDALVVNEEVSAQGGLETGGGWALGGAISLEAGLGGIAINADLDATSGGQGPGGDGGAIDVSSLGDIVVGAGVDLLSKSDSNGGDGGGISLVSHGASRCSNDATRECLGDADCASGGTCQRLGGQVSVGASATIDARGHTGGGNQGSGADVVLRGCGVSLGSGSVINVAGHRGGDVTLTGRGSLTTHATSSVVATGTAQAGSIRLVVPAGTTPGASGQSTPTATVVSDPHTNPCS